jgi:hypothetical protein
VRRRAGLDACEHVVDAAVVRVVGDEEGERAWWVRAWG